MRLFSCNSCHLFCVSIVLLPGQSYIALYNAPQFLAELKNNTMARFKQMVSGAFLSSIVFFVFVMSVGFSTLAGIVLNNHASSDPLATLARFAIGPALLTECPLTFSALKKESWTSVRLSRPFPPHPLLFHALSHSTLPLLYFCVSSCLGGTGRLDLDRGALVLKDVGFVVIISGAMFGCLLIFIVPALMTISNIKVRPLSPLSCPSEGGRQSGRNA